MATPRDVAEQLAILSHGIAKAVDDAPTGVEPGYSAALGGTVMPNGKLRYAKQTEGEVIGPVALAQQDGNYPCSSNSTDRLNFNFVYYDFYSGITTGASTWKYTATKAAYYYVQAWNYITPNGHIWTEGDALSLEIKPSTGGTLVPALQTMFATTTSSSLDFTLFGSEIVHLTAGQSFYVQFHNVSSFTRYTNSGNIAIYKMS
jgi:hypothetical protein